MANIVPLSSIVTRPPEHGRIRFGVRAVMRNGKEAPRAIERWRFTSPDRKAIEQLAELYGGRCTPWTDPKASPQNQFEVTTDASTIEVLLNTDDCYTVAYEQWGGKGIDRRCDGETCTFYGAGKPMTRPCICADQPTQTCKPYSRVNMLLPGVDLGGVWRLEVKGLAFMHEAPGMIQTIRQLHEGMARVELMLTKRTKRGVDDKGRPTVNHFIVPQFVVRATPDQLLAGMHRVSSISGPPRRELNAAPDDEVVDAEVLDPVLNDLWEEEDGDDGLLAQLEQSVQIARAARHPSAGPLQDGWDIPPPDISVKRNPNPEGPKWIRK